MKFLIAISLVLLLAGAKVPSFCTQDEPISVDLLVFSGTENPHWKLDSKQAEHLCLILLKTKTESSKCNSVKMGYNGFLISKNFRVYKSAEVEEYLLSTIPHDLPFKVFEHISERIIEIKKETHQVCLSEVKTITDFDCLNNKVVGPDTAPDYNPSVDDQGCFISDQYDNNCYNYGSDIATGTFAKPGRGSGQMFSENTCEDVRAAAERDGLTWVGTDLPSGQPAKGHYIALLIWPDFNFHWIRKDSSNYWSHKPGQTEVRDIDNNNEKINDPSKSDFSPWSQFCGYMIVVPSTAQVD